MHKKFGKILIKNYCLKLPENKKDLAEFENFLKKNQNKIAAIFIEPMVQCAGGMKFSNAEILKEIFKLSRKYQVLFIADECAVGFYRLGKKFACNFAKIKPDILVVGKALTGGFITLAATLVSKNIYQKFLGKSLDLALMHGPTFMGNALACSAANASLDLFEKNNYQKKVVEVEKILKTELEKCINLKNVKQVRVLGAIGVVEIEKSWEEILELRKDFVAAGIFLRPFANVIYVMPALTISQNELIKICKVIYKILAKN
jgi:adenosylmethionine-8-amino-7-oxononanoate aminotransferase